VVKHGKIIEQVVKFCQKRLLKDDEALEYLTQKRQLTLDSIDKFQIGLFPNDLRDLFEAIDPKEARAAGIIKHASKSMFRLWNLVMPIRDVYGNYVALAGRTMMSEEERERQGTSKYMNSVYPKTQHLYGLNFAKDSVIKENKVYVVEGYFDVIMPHQKGLENVVATCGSFLSARHIALLSRYTNNIVLLLDNEEDAQEKANKIVDKRKYDGITLTAMNPFPENIKDIDQYLRTYFLENLLSKLEQEEKESYDNVEPLWE
jgi:DNA primase